MAATIKLGLCNPPEPIYLYVNYGESNGQPYVWYNFDINNNKTIPVHQRGLTGYITELRLTQKEFKGKDNLKLDIVVSADELYVVRSGIETNFAKTFLLAASQIQDFSKPLIIVAVPGEENVVFCRLYDAETKIRFRREWDKDANWGDIIAGIQELLGQNQDSSLPELVTQEIPPPQDLRITHPQDLRIKQVRHLLNYPVDLIKNWLHLQNALMPSQLSSQKVDELVKKMCLDWASKRFNNSHHAAQSYKKYVLTPVADGADEVAMIQAWIEHTESKT